jgi:N-acetylgalactosamine kinase
LGQDCLGRAAFPQIAHDLFRIYSQSFWLLLLLLHGCWNSSSSMVCSFTLAMAQLFRHQNLIQGSLASKEDLAGICAKSERFIGVESGGMDQAISFLAERNYAMRIEFHPKLSASKVQLPSSAVFVLCNSLVEHRLQSAASGSGYNVRVVECRLAAAVLGHYKDLPVQQIRTLLDFQLLAIPGSTSVPVDLDRCLEWAEALLHEEPYTAAELESLLGSEVFQSYLGCVRDVEILNNLQLKKRARHVFSEAKRVVEFQSLANHLCTSNDFSLPNLQRLGNLMNASHDSCKNDFECSCKELDEIVEFCQSAGAVAARLTGAGWGGWCISMIPANIQEQYLKQLQEYYSTRSSLPVNLLMLETQPSDGACVFSSSS